MNDKTDAAAHAVQLDARLTVAYFDTGEPKSLDIRYRLDNAGTLPIALLNAVALNADDPPPPSFTVTAEGDLTVAYQLHAPPHAGLALPHNVYAMRVPPGEHFVRSVSIRLLAAYPDQQNASALVSPKRVRLCQAYTIFSVEGFTQLDDRPNPWLAQPGLFSEQKRLCSEWVDLRERTNADK